MRQIVVRRGNDGPLDWGPRADAIATLDGDPPRAPTAGEPAHAC
jgi:hypothetical protein